MAETSLGQLLLSEIFPPDVYRPGQPIDKGTAAKLFGSLAKDHPDEYRDTLHKATLFGREAARATGGGTFSLRHLRTPPQAAARRALLREQLTDVLLNVPEDEQDAAIVAKLRSLQATDKDDTVAELAAEGNPFADMLKGAGRGNPAAIARLVSSDLMYADNRGREIPVPVLNSYSHGLTPAEYVASTFGVRSGVVTAKVGIGMGGYAAKLLLAAAHRMVVTGEDADESLEAASANRGLPVETNDKDNIGALLAIPVGPYKRNTRLDAKTLAHIKKLGHDEIVVRSPLTSADPSGGVYARDVGYRERDRLPDIGESVGITAAGAVSEPVSQALLCLAEGTSVRMADMTVKSIEDIQAGDWVLGADTHGNAFPVRVLRTYDNGLRECVVTKYRFKQRKDCLELASTVDHKILQTRVTTGQKSDADNYKSRVESVNLFGSKVYAIPVQRTQAAVTPGPGRDLAFLVGFLIGDGCYTAKTAGKWGSGGFSCADASLITAINDAAKPFGLSAKFHAGSECYWHLTMDKQTIVSRDAASGRVTAGARHPLKVWMASRGMWHKYAHEKVLPGGVLQWDDDSLRGLLQGLFSSDGSVFESACEDVRGNAASRTYVSFSSTSYRLVEQVRELLILRLNCYVGEIYPATKKRKRPLYNFAITPIGEVRKLLRFLQDIPGVRGVKLRDGLQATSERRKQSEHYFAKRHSMTVIGEVPTHDIEVDHPDHLFVLANGLIVSNSAKHKGGLAEDNKDELTGFALIDRLLNTPKEFREAATHTENDGRVEAIREAEQGGQYVKVGSSEFYVPPSRKLAVKIGDTVEAGDQLTDGIANPRMVVAHKGLGEGAMQLTFSLRKAVGGASRRNVELIVRGLVDRVRVTDEFDDYSPDDVVPYNEVAAKWKSRVDSTPTDTRFLSSGYLEQPVLHYSVGTRITPSVAATLQKHKIGQVIVNQAPPPFEPELVRATDLLRTDSDWMTRQIGTGLEKGLLESAHRGRVSDENATSFVPARARAVDFGSVGKVKLQPPKSSELPDLGY